MLTAMGVNGENTRQVVEQVRNLILNQEKKFFFQLLTHITDTSKESRLCMSGDPGAGRTSILANLVLRLLPLGESECTLKCAAKQDQPYKVFIIFKTNFRILIVFCRYSFILHRTLWMENAVD
jgi:hypothetical protein